MRKTDVSGGRAYTQDAGTGHSRSDQCSPAAAAGGSGLGLRHAAARVVGTCRSRRRHLAMPYQFSADRSLARPSVRSVHGTTRRTKCDLASDRDDVMLSRSAAQTEAIRRSRRGRRRQTHKAWVQSVHFGFSRQIPTVAGNARKLSAKLPINCFHVSPTTRTIPAFVTFVLALVCFDLCTFRSIFCNLVVL